MSRKIDGKCWIGIAVLEGAICIDILVLQQASNQPVDDKQAPQPPDLVIVQLRLGAVRIVARERVDIEDNL